MKSGAAGAALMGALVATSAAAQDNSTIGPPQLKDFQLPGQRTAPPRPVGPVDDSATAAPPAAQRQAPPPAPPVVTVTPPPPTTPAPTPAPSGSAPQPAATRKAEPAQTARRAPAPSAAPSTQAPPASPTSPSQPSASPVTSQPFTPAPATSGPTPAPAPASPSPEEPDSGSVPLWLVLPILLLGLAGGALLWMRRRRGNEAYAELDEAMPAAEPPAPAAPLPVAAKQANGMAAAIPGEKLAPVILAENETRAWLEVELKPSRAAATDKEAIVHYELTLRNVGEAPAGNIRIDSKLFNAGAEADIKAFLGGAIHDQSGSPHVLIAPGDELRLGSAIAIPKEEVREIVIEGRPLFVPAIAVNVAYNWGSNGAGAGRTSKSWLVGREAEQPSQKMGAFRLDLGPRIYRSVGQRQTGLALMV